jgi:hypothetical protein
MTELDVLAAPVLVAILHQDLSRGCCDLVGLGVGSHNSRHMSDPGITRAYPKVMSKTSFFFFFLFSNFGTRQMNGIR